MDGPLVLNYAYSTYPMSTQPTPYKDPLKHLQGHTVTAGPTRPEGSLNYAPSVPDHRRRPLTPLPPMLPVHNKKYTPTIIRDYPQLAKGRPIDLNFMIRSIVHHGMWKWITRRKEGRFGPVFFSPTCNTRWFQKPLTKTRFPKDMPVLDLRGFQGGEIRKYTQEGLMRILVNENGNYEDGRVRLGSSALWFLNMRHWPYYQSLELYG